VSSALFLILAFGAQTPAQAASQASSGPVAAPVITTELIPDHAQVGDHVVLKVTVKHDANDTLELPTEIDFGKLELIDKSRITHGTKQVSDELVFKLAAFETGEFSTPALPFNVAGKTFTADSRTLTVTSVLPASQPVQAPDPQNSNAAAPQVQRKSDGEPLSIREALYWPFLALAGILVVTSIYLLWRRRQKKPAVVKTPQIPEIDPHQAALQLLQHLRKKPYLNQGAFKPFYLEATEIVRAYLSQRFAINALDLTTAELLMKLETLSAPGLDRDGLKRWLEHADLVKFAKEFPAAQQPLQMLDFFESMIWHTRPPEIKSAVTTGPHSREAA